MFKLIFSNRYAALVWVALALFGAAAFVSEGGGVDTIGQTTEQLRGQQAAVDQLGSAGQPPLQSEAAEEEPASKPGDPTAPLPGDVASPVPGDIVIGPDGRRYQVLGPPPAADGEPVAQAAN